MFKDSQNIGTRITGAVYEEVLCYELAKAGLRFSRQQAIAVVYEYVKMDLGFRADIIIEDKLIIELKSVEAVAPVHHKIVLTYLRLTNKKLALLVNFHVELIKDGIKRIANGI